MKIRISEIPEEGMMINADSTKDAWLDNALTEVLTHKNLQKDDGGRLNLQLFRSNKDVTIVGGVILQFHPTCDRCLVSFKKQEQIPIHQVLIPQSSPKSRGKKDANVDDEEVTFYKGDEIDLSDIVREGVILDQRMVNFCKDDCKGLCPVCGVNLNEKVCNCKKKKKGSKSPFAAIKGLKIKKRKKT